MGMLYRISKIRQLKQIALFVSWKVDLWSQETWMQWKSILTELTSTSYRKSMMHVQFPEETTKTGKAPMTSNLYLWASSDNQNLQQANSSSVNISWSGSQIKGLPYRIIVTAILKIYMYLPQTKDILEHHNKSVDGVLKLEKQKEV